MTTKRLTKEDELTAAIARVDTIEARMAERADRISQIEAEQYRAAAAGDAHDPEAFRTKLELADQEGIDAKLLDEARRIVAGVAEDIRRERELAQLAEMGERITQAAAAADAARDLYPTLLWTTMARWREDAEVLVQAKADIHTADVDELNLRQAAAALAARNGQPNEGVKVVDRVDQLARTIFNVDDIPAARVWNGPDPQVVARELAVAMFTDRPKGRTPSGAELAAEASRLQAEMEAARRKARGLPTFLEEQQQTEYAQARADREERIARWGAEQMENDRG